MKPIQLLMLAVLAGSDTGAFAYEVVKELVNGGAPAHGLVVLLDEPEIVTDNYDGDAAAYFRSFDSGVIIGLKTKLTWSEFSDDDNDVVDTSQTVRIGWTTRDASCHVQEVYWTDENGDRIPGSTIYNTTPGWNLLTDDDLLRIRFQNLQPDPIIIRDLEVGAFTVPIPPAGLSDDNPALIDALEPVPGGEFILADPGVPIELNINWQHLLGTIAVLRYVVEAPDSGASATDFIQVKVIEDDPCPEDLDGDGVVGHSDLAILLAAYHKDARGDLDGDGHTTHADLGIILAAYGRQCPE